MKKDEKNRHISFSTTSISKGNSEGNQLSVDKIDVQESPEDEIINLKINTTNHTEIRWEEKIIFYEESIFKIDTGLRWPKWAATF